MRTLSIALAVVASAAALVLPGAAASANTPVACDSGNFCVYRNTDGRTLCSQWTNNSSDWGSCANHDQTLFNNGTPDYFDSVDIYWGRGYSGAYACLGLGDYWLFANQNAFDHVGQHGGDGAADGSTGLGQQVGNNAASHKWAHGC